MKTIPLIIFLVFFAAACSAPKLTTDSLKWQVTYPNPNDSTLVQVKGLYTNLGRIMYNNGKSTNCGSVMSPYSPIPTAAQIIAAEKIVLAKQVDLFQPRGGRQKMLTTKKDTLFVLNKIQSYSRFYQTYFLPDGDFLLLVILVEALPWEMKKYSKTPDRLVLQYSIFINKYYSDYSLINIRTGEMLDFNNTEHKCLNIPQYIKLKKEELENQIYNSTPESKDQIIQELEQKLKLLEEMNRYLERQVKYLGGKILYRHGD